MPPSKTPPISPTGNYSEPYKLDFKTWAKEIANLSLRYSNLKEYAIEDLQENFNLGYINQSYLDSILATGKSINPKLLFDTLTPTSKTYYVSNSGNDNNSGLSQESAWRTLGKINSSTFNPGDSILFKSGDSWVGENQFYYPIGWPASVLSMLAIGSSGTSLNPIFIGSYGSGDKPYFKSDPAIYAVGILADGSYITIDGLKIDSCNYEAIMTLGDHTIIQNCEIIRSGTGVGFHSRGNLVTKCYIHDGVLTKDDTPANTFGANGVAIYDVNNVVSYNTFKNCMAPTKNYGGVDGAFIEFQLDGTDVDSSNIHHNIVNNADIFVEFGGSGGSAKDITFAYNVFYKNSLASNLTSVIGLLEMDNIIIDNLRLINNTIYNNSLGATAGHGLIAWSPYTHTLTSSELVLYNNIFISDSCAMIEAWAPGMFGGTNNIFYRYDGSSTLGFPLGTLGIREDPTLTDIDGNNFVPLAGSPAIDGGIEMGYTTDILGNPIVGNPNIGAYESIQQ